MQNPTKIGQIIAGKYELIKALKETHLYQWIGAVNLKTQKAHTIQIHLNDCPKGQIKEAFDYFDAVKNIRREGIVPPEQVISNGDLPLVIIHSESFGSILDLSRDFDLALTLKYLSEASELLHTVNNKKLIHGQVNPKSFILKDNKVYLSGFGYAPFLLQGNQDAIKDCGDFLPPEIADTNSAQKSRDTIDTYAFAKTVAYWFPNICTSAWYLQATNPDPNQRFKRMRNLFEELKKALTDAFSNTTEINDDSNQIEVTETEIKLEPQTSGGIIPKHILEIELEPPEAGRVEGGGKYAEGRQVNVKAIAFPDWEFIGWDGDIVQSNNSLDLVIEKNLKITARYKKIPKLRGSIQIEIYPSEAQEVARVSGVGNHPLGTSVEINAWSISDKWRFSRWTGDINVAKTPFAIALASDIKVIAEFAIVPDLTKPNKPSPKITGDAFRPTSPEESATSELTSPDPSVTKPIASRKLGDAFRQTLLGESATTELKSSEPEIIKLDIQVVDDDIQEVANNISDGKSNAVEKQKTNVGSAFTPLQTEEPESSQSTVQQPTKKPIIGTAFGESK